MNDCVFCGRVDRGEYDYDDMWSVAFQPLNPVTPGHFLVIPRKHAAHALESPGGAGKALEMAGYLANRMNLESVNFITSAGKAASQSVFHLHVHVIPRREGDGLILPWTDQQEREWLQAEVSRYLCAVTEHGSEAVAATARSLADRLTLSRTDRELLTSILTRAHPETGSQAFTRATLIEALMHLKIKVTLYSPAAMKINAESMADAIIEALGQAGRVDG